MSSKKVQKESKLTKISQNQVAASLSELPTPLLASSAEDETPRFKNQTLASSRTNRAADSESPYKYANIENGITPFRYRSIRGNGYYSCENTISLTQKAYYNFAVFRNTIDLMTEFSCNDIYFQGGSKKSQDFFYVWLNKIGIKGLQDRFFREYYRSGNVFIYKFDAQLKNADLAKMTQTFGLPSKASVSIPIRYIILNPVDINIAGNISFSQGVYYKVLTDFEAERLRNPKTEEDKQVLQSMDPKTRELLVKKLSDAVLLPLDPSKINAIFYKKQDYEPFSVPMGFPVLADINAKDELKKIDIAIARTMQQAILLITMGEQKPDGTMNINPKNMAAMQVLFENQSAGRVLVSDYTTKVEWKIPQIADILTQAKYEVLDRDIQMGLNYVLVGDEKFANQSIKVQVFLERLRQAREVFLNEFLIPEIKRTATNLGFKNFPTPVFKDIDLKNELEFARVYTRLVEIGVLTPAEGLEAISSGRLPTPEENNEAQTSYRSDRDKGLYEPIVGGPYTSLKIADQAAKIKTDLAKVNGRPSGTGKPLPNKKVSPMGGSITFKELINKSDLLFSKIEDYLKKEFKAKILSEDQKKVAAEIGEVIMSNNSIDKWYEKDIIKDFVANPIDRNKEMNNKIIEIAAEHQVSNYVATLLYHLKPQ